LRFPPFPKHDQVPKIPAWDFQGLVYKETPKTILDPAPYSLAVNLSNTWILPLTMNSEMPLTAILSIQKCGIRVILADYVIG